MKQAKNSHEKLDLWQRSIDFVAKIYEKTRAFPEEEKYGLVSQMRRSAVSIPANIAEGAARKTVKEYLQFLYIARGSLSELDAYFAISLRLGFLNVDDYQELKQEHCQIGKMIFGVVRYLKNTPSNALTT